MTKKINRIALVTDGIWPYVLGGMQKHSYYLCKYFAQNKITVDLYHFNQSNLDISELGCFSLEERQYINSIVLVFPEKHKGFGHYLKNSYSYSTLIFEKLKNKIEHYDFIYTKGFSGWKLLEEKRKGTFQCCKVGVKFHGYEMFQEPPDFKSKLQQHLLLRKPVKQISLMADVVFSYGGKITDIIRSIGVEANKIIELPSGIEEYQICGSIHETVFPVKFVYLGRYERRKGIEELNKAIKKLPLNFDAEFHFIGPIPENKKLKAANITYHGEIRDLKNLNAVLSACDVLVCPSKSEGLPNVLLEAMSRGLTVIATNSGATNVLVNDKNGWLIESAKGNRLNEKFLEIESFDLEILDIKKRKSIETIKENFTWEKLIIVLIRKLEAFI